MNDRSAGGRPVQRDLESGYVSIEAGRKQHGVIVDPSTSKVDAVATRASGKACDWPDTPPP
jgi:hypothetical protein